MVGQVAPNLWAHRNRPPYPSGGTSDRFSRVNSDFGHHRFAVASAPTPCGWRSAARRAAGRSPGRATRPSGRGAESRSRRVSRALAIAVVVASMVRPSPAAAQRVAAPVRTLVGDVALILRPEVDGALAVGVAGPTRALTLTVRASDARRWADSAARLAVALPRAAASRARAAAKAPTGGKGGAGTKGGGTAAAGAVAPNDSVRRARVVLEEPGVGAGSLVLSRADSAGTRTFLLFADDAELDPIRQELTLAEARTLVRLVQRAAAPIPARRPRR